MFWEGTLVASRRLLPLKPAPQVKPVPAGRKEGVWSGCFLCTGLGWKPVKNSLPVSVPCSPGNTRPPWAPESDDIDASPAAAAKLKAPDIYELLFKRCCVPRQSSWHEIGIHLLSFQGRLTVSPQMCASLGAYWCWAVKDAGILGLQRRGIQSRASDEAWSLRVLCDKVLLKYKRDRQSFWHRHQMGAGRVPHCSL